MTLTLTDNTELLIVSEYATGSNQSVTLTVTLNCTTEYDALEIPVGDEDYTLVPEDLVADATEFEDGIYTIRVVTVQEDGDIVTENRCILIDPSLNCDMLTTYTDLESDQEQIVKALSYHALVAIQECDTCSCSSWCTLYNTVTDETCVEDASPCGCS